MAERGKDKARQGRCPGWRPRGPDSIIASIPVSFLSSLGDLSDFTTGRAGLGVRLRGTYHSSSEPYQTNLIECIRPNQGMVRSLNEVASQGTGARMMTLRRAETPGDRLDRARTPPVDTALPFARRSLVGRPTNGLQPVATQQTRRQPQTERSVHCWEKLYRGLSRPAGSPAGRRVCRGLQGTAQRSLAWHAPLPEGGRPLGRFA